MPDGFELEFTKAVNEATARDVASYQVKTFTYEYHHEYGSPVINQGECGIKAIEVSPDNKKVRLVVEGMKEGYIHELDVKGIRSAEENYPILHPTGYYTLNKIPDGQKMEITPANQVKVAAAGKELSGQGMETKKSASKSSQRKKTGSSDSDKAITYADVKPLLEKYTCTSCHATNKRQVGPPFMEIAKRNYSIDKIVELVHKPQPGNWPDYATPMAPMAHVPKGDVEKIARWIRTLK